MACTFHRIYIEVRSVFSKLLGTKEVEAIEEGKSSPPETRRATPEEIFGTVYMEVISTPEEKRRKRRQRGAKHTRQVAIARKQKQEMILSQRDLYRRHRFCVKAKLNHARAYVASNSFGTQTDWVEDAPKIIVPTVSVEVQTITAITTAVESQTQTDLFVEIQTKDVGTEPLVFSDICTQTEVGKEICTQTEEVKEICTQIEEMKEICTQTEEVKEICIQTEEVKEICTQTEEVKEISTQTDDVNEICSQADDVNEICSQADDVNEICSQIDDVSKICAQTDDVKPTSDQTVQASKKINDEPNQALDRHPVEAAEERNVNYPGCAPVYAEAHLAKVDIAPKAAEAANVTDANVDVIGEKIIATDDIQKVDVAVAVDDKVLEDVLLGDMVGNVSSDVLGDLLSEVLAEEMAKADSTPTPAVMMEVNSDDMAVSLQGVIYNLVGEVVTEVAEEMVFDVLEEAMVEAEDAAMSSDDKVTLMENTPHNADVYQEPMEASEYEMSDGDQQEDEDVDAVVGNVMDLMLDAVVEEVYAYDMAAQYAEYKSDSEDEEERDFVDVDAVVGNVMDLMLDAVVEEVYAYDMAAQYGEYMSDSEDEDESQACSPLRTSFSIILEEDELALEMSESGYGSNQSIDTRSARSQDNGSMRIQLGDMNDDEGVDAELKISISNLNIEVSDSAINKATKNEVIPELFFSLRNGALNVIGRGSYGNVYQAYYHGDDVAVKVTALKHMCDLPESQVINKLEYHPCIIEMLANYSVLNKYEGIVMEAAKGTTTALVSQIRDTMLDNRAETVFDPFYTVYYTSAISQAIKYLHDSGIVHLDINPSNILLMDSGVPKISDFSSSVVWKPQQPDLNVYPIGTEGFQAPEVINETGYNSSADWFAFGAVLCYVNMGRLPWGTCQMTEMEMLERGTLEKHLLDSELFHQHLLGLVLILLQTNPKVRMTDGTKELLAAFDCHEVCQDLTTPPGTSTLEFIQTQFC